MSSPSDAFRAYLEANGPTPARDLLAATGYGPDPANPARHFHANLHLGFLTGAGFLNDTNGVISLPISDGWPDPEPVPDSDRESAESLARYLAIQRDALRRHGFNTPDIRSILVAIIRTQTVSHIGAVN